MAKDKEFRGVIPESGFFDDGYSMVESSSSSTFERADSETDAGSREDSSSRSEAQLTGSIDPLEAQNSAAPVARAPTPTHATSGERRTGPSGKDASPKADAAEAHALFRDDSERSNLALSSSSTGAVASDGVPPAHLSLEASEGDSSASSKGTSVGTPPVSKFAESSTAHSSSTTGAPSADTPRGSSVGGGESRRALSQAEREGSLRARIDGGEVVFSMENVAVHPSALASERIRGRLRLVRHESTVYLSWKPYTAAESSKSAGASAKGQQYAIRAVALSEMRSIRRQTPTLGWQYAIIVLNTGLALPPLYFHDGGVRGFVAAIREHTTLIKSPDDPFVYLVNDSEDPFLIQRSLTSLRSSKAFANLQLGRRSREGESEGTMAGAGVAHLSGWSKGTGADGPGLVLPPPGQLRPQDGGRDAGIQVLQGFAGLTRLARNVLGGRGLQQPGDRVLGGGDPSLAERMPMRGPLPPPPSLPLQQSSSSSSSSGTAESRRAAKAAAEGPMAASGVGQFELLDPVEEELAATRAPAQDAGPPFSHEEWVSALDTDGRVTDKDAVCQQIFKRGLQPELRREVWKFLLGYYSFDSTHAERRQLDEDKRREYNVYKTQWESVTEVQAKRFAKYRERVSRIEKDVVRTDRKLAPFADDDSPSIGRLRSILMTYSFYNFDLGYCQGMSDLLSPILVVMEDEAEAFWIFAQFMESMGKNFNRDQTGMHGQLLALSKLMKLLDQPLVQYLESIDAANFFCCFRWLLILFKREFEFEDVLKLWERIWTCPHTRSFHLYICAAILKRYRRKIFDEQMQFDVLLRFINELSGRVDLEDTLQYAEALCLWAGKRGEACMPVTLEDREVLIEGPESLQQAEDDS